PALGPAFCVSGPACRSLTRAPRAPQGDEMISALKRFLADLGADARPVPTDVDDGRLAAAALLYHVTGIDGEVGEAERARLRTLLHGRFGLDDAGLDALISAAEDADRQAIDLYG